VLKLADEEVVGEFFYNNEIRMEVDDCPEQWQNPVASRAISGAQNVTYP